jgi:Flp pilus assembly protein TadG
MRAPLQFSQRWPRWVKDERGAAAIEFAIVATPFFLFTLGLIGLGLYFFTMSSLEYGVEAAARQIRTGQAQTSALTVGQFKSLVCNAAGSYINCNKLSVVIQSGASWSNVTPQGCFDASHNMVGSTGTANDPVEKYSGDANEVVLITLCYQWDLAQSFSYLKLGTNADGSGSAVVQASTAFVTEPYSS